MSIFISEVNIETILSAAWQDPVMRPWSMTCSVDCHPGNSKKNSYVNPPSKIPSGDQTWRAGKLTIEIGDFPKPPFTSGIFQQAMFDYRRVSADSNPKNIDIHTLTMAQFHHTSDPTFI